LADIAWFRPVAGVALVEPDGWTVPGLHTNFFAVSGVQVVPGELLGAPAVVRFTPVGFRWDYGDGTSVSLGMPGGSWAVLGVGEFDRTPTSHVYAVEGVYTIRLVIDFAAEYRFGSAGGWVPIAGTVPVPANELHIVVDGATTVLVEHDCLVNPTGPGC